MDPPDDDQATADAAAAASKRQARANEGLEARGTERIRSPVAAGSGGSSRECEAALGFADVSVKGLFYMLDGTDASRGGDKQCVNP